MRVEVHCQGFVQVTVDKLAKDKLFKRQEQRMPRRDLNAQAPGLRVKVITLEWSSAHAVEYGSAG